MKKFIGSVLTALFLAAALPAAAQITTDGQNTVPPQRAPKANIPPKHKGHYKPRHAKAASSHVEVR